MTIPKLLREPHSDFIGLAQTGTGKTAAFGLPLLELVNQDSSSTQALIMAPTRELAQQISFQLNELCPNNRRLGIRAVFGGNSINRQIQNIRKSAQIIIATPGRLLDLIQRKVVKLDHLRFLVLDEADEMLNMGFRKDIERILSITGKHRSIWLFSATMPQEIRRIVKTFMIDPEEVIINRDERINKDIEHRYVITKASHKIPMLRKFLDNEPQMRSIMFCRTRRETKRICNELIESGYSTESLHGDLSQAQRNSVMKRFRQNSMQLLVATDVAARGLDVVDLTHVIHHSLPDNPDSYTHRSGRTARAGKKGISLAFITPNEEGRIGELERRMKVKFEPYPTLFLTKPKKSKLKRFARQGGGMQKIKF